MLLPITTSDNRYTASYQHPNFRIVESDRRNGKIVFTVECDTPSAGIIIHFLKVASEFAHRLDYMAEAEAKSHERESERLAGESERRARREATLRLYDSMVGVPASKRIARVREILSTRGQTLRYGDVEAEINLARQDERRGLELKMRDAAIDAGANNCEMRILSATGTGSGMGGQVYSGGYRRERVPIPPK